MGQSRTLLLDTGNEAVDDLERLRLLASHCWLAAQLSQLLSHSTCRHALVILHRCAQQCLGLLCAPLWRYALSLTRKCPARLRWAAQQHTQAHTGHCQLQHIVQLRILLQLGVGKFRALDWLSCQGSHLMLKQLGRWQADFGSQTAGQVRHIKRMGAELRLVR